MLAYISRFPIATPRNQYLFFSKWRPGRSSVCSIQHVKPTYTSSNYTSQAMQRTENATGEVLPTQEEDVGLQAEDGSEFLAFLSYPCRRGDPKPCKAILLMSDIMGWENRDTRAVAMRLSAAGYPTIVPDQFRDSPWTEGRSMSEYEEWRAQHDLERVRGDMKAAGEYMKKCGFGPDLGLLGFCFGGGRLMEEVARGTEGLNPKAAVAFYPTSK
eukprot:GFKZ01007178.1.p1 GENE.GFKZ01007178.1~~GFKZ01007178.1.p1  ORF type:complete len:214 (+),score=11.64 GFKZ01007178.1:292-933(+)